MTSDDADPRRDEELLRAFLDGDERALGELFRRHAATVHAVVRRYARGPVEAADLVQRAFLRALEASRRGLRADGDLQFRAWLLRIAVNLGKNLVRDAARWASAPVEAVDRALPDPPLAEDAAVRGERARLMRAAVLTLPRRQREVLTLRLDAELPFAEIAQALGITENAAKVSFHHATRALRAALASEEGDAP